VVLTYGFYFYLVCRYNRHSAAERHSQCSHTCSAFVLDRDGVLSAGRGLLAPDEFEKLSRIHGVPARGAYLASLPRKKSSLTEATKKCGI
jgi:hypothetical protein